MKEIGVDEAKIQSVMEWIEKAAALMAEQDWAGDQKVKEELEECQRALWEITGNGNLRVEEFQRYWSYTSLETMARKALMAPPAKEELTDEQIKEAVCNILSLTEAEIDWQLQYLKLNTGLDNLSDYIFYPALVDLSPQAALSDIADRIIADRKQSE